MLELAEPFGSISQACPPWIHGHRNRVERLWARLKEWRAVATRCEKTARSPMGVLCTAATMDRIEPHKGRGGSPPPASLRGPRSALPSPPWEGAEP